MGSELKPEMPTPTGCPAVRIKNTALLSLFLTYQSLVMVILFLDKSGKEVVPSQGFFYLKENTKEAVSHAGEGQALCVSLRLGQSLLRPGVSSWIGSLSVLPF